MARGKGQLIEERLLFEDCFVSESWLSMIILLHSNCPEGYIMVRKDRAGSRIGGDFATICRNDWKVKALNVTDSLEFESFVIRNRASLSFRLRSKTLEP